MDSKVTFCPICDEPGTVVKIDENMPPELLELFKKDSIDKLCGRIQKICKFQREQRDAYEKGNKIKIADLQDELAKKDAMIKDLEAQLKSRNE